MSAWSRPGSMDTATTHEIDRIEVEIAGVPVSLACPRVPGLRPFVESVLLGEDYPLVFPGIFEPSFIIDIGAHAGAATIYFKMHYPRAEVVAFEPSQATFELLRANTAGLEGVVVRRAALAAADGEARLFSVRHSSMQHSTKPNAENTSDFEWVPVLEARPALEALGRSSYSIVKIDTEGCELEILESIRGLLPAIDVIYVEYHSEADRLAIDRILGPRFVLATARADGPHRGTNGYVRDDVLERCSERMEARYVHPKE